VTRIPALVFGGIMEIGVYVLLYSGDPHNNLVGDDLRPTAVIHGVVHERL
jgi:hypothetical protein